MHCSTMQTQGSCVQEVHNDLSHACFRPAIRCKSLNIAFEIEVVAQACSRAKVTGYPVFATPGMLSLSA